MKRKTIEELIEASSLGTPEAKAICAKADPKLVARILARLDEAERCPNCNGRGHDIGVDQCFVCRGTGKRKSGG